ncbi:hypothetical protein ACI6Q2_09690 [Chitinophagaceae bacterium LWZ2-11]
MQIKTFFTTAFLCILITQGYSQTYKLFTFYNDGSQTMPRSDEPYSLFRNGKPAGGGITNSKGQILTALHKPGVREDWVIRFVTNEVGVLINSDGATKTISLYNHTSNWEQHIEGRHDYYMDSNKLKQPYYWFELYNYAGNNWSNKPYTIIYNNKVLVTDSTNDRGFIFFRTDSIKENTPFQLRICGGAVFNITMLSMEKENFLIENDPVEKISCSDAASFTFNDKAFNFGRPLLHAGIGYGKMWSEELAEREAENRAAEERKEKKIADYKSGKIQLSSPVDIVPEQKLPDDLLGTFGVPANSPLFSDTITSKDILLYTIFKTGNDYFCKNLETGDTTQVEFNLQPRSGSLEIASAKLDDAKTTLVCYNFQSTQATDEIMQSFAEGLEKYGDLGLVPTIEDLRKTHYYIIGTAGNIGAYFIPVIRISK